MNGDVYLAGQFASYPNRLAQQMAMAGGGKFTQPLMEDENGFGNRIIFEIDGVQRPTLNGGPVNQANLVNISHKGPFNNMGVPGATVGDLITPTMNSDRATDYYQRFAVHYGVTTIMEEVMAQEPTFVTLWIGSNDAMGFALRGGDLRDSPRQAITETSVFRSRFQEVVDQLNGTPGIVANIPRIGVLPHFDMGSLLESSFIGVNIYDGLSLSSAQAEMANARILEEEKRTGQTSGISFSAGDNAVLVEDLNAPCGFRKIEATDKVLLILLSEYSDIAEEIKQNGLGWASETELRPIPHKYILDKDELKLVSDAIEAYNTVIEDIVSNTPNLYLVNVAAEMDKLIAGIRVEDDANPFVFTTDYVAGSFFSWDGIHPTGEGYAYITNVFIDAINKNFNSDLQKINVRTGAAGSEP